MMRKQFVLWVAILLAVGLCGAAARAEKPAIGRPQILWNSVYTAQGTRLRGTTISTEGNPPGEFVMTPQEMQELTHNGLNALHIYVERRSDGLPVGASAENCDYLVDLAERYGMYVVITMGEMNHEPEAYAQDVQFLADFWSFYAPRYADRAHVIYEICNEVPLVEDIAEIQARVYRQIRSAAPETLVLFYSFSNLLQMETVLAHVSQTEGIIDEAGLWENAALAFHGYECTEDSRGAEAMREIIHMLTRAGYPLINTEVPNRYELSGYADAEILRVLEEEGISWLSFVFHTRIHEASFWRGPLEAAGIAWTPDQGDWPDTEALYPFGRLAAWDATASDAEYTNDGRKTVFRVADGQYVAFHRLGFGTREPLAVAVTLRADAPGTLAVRRDAQDGPVLARIEFPDTGGEYQSLDAYLDAPVGVLTDVCFVWESAGVASFQQASFVLPGPPDYTDPSKRKVSAMEFPFRTGSLWRTKSTDLWSEATLQVDYIANGDALRFDRVAFYGQDVRLHIRAKPLAGGRIELVAGDGGLERYELGTVEIRGVPGEWAEFSALLDMSTVLMFDPYRQLWDLELRFAGEEGKELFAISEFWFEPVVQ